MSLINSFINQIGREAGRDFYNNISDYRNSNKRYLSKNEKLIKDIQSTELSTRENSNLIKIVNLVEATKGVDIDDIDFPKVFFSLDSKIDLFKEHSDKLKSRFEDLDSENLSNFKRLSIDHKRWIESKIFINEKKTKSRVKSFLLGMFGLSPLLGKRNSNLSLQIISSLLYLSWMCLYITYINNNKTFSIGVISFISIQMILSGVISAVFTDSFNKKCLRMNELNKNYKIYLENFPV